MSIALRHQDSLRAPQRGKPAPRGASRLVAKEPVRLRLQRRVLLAGDQHPRHQRVPSAKSTQSLQPVVTRQAVVNQHQVQFGPAPGGLQRGFQAQHRARVHALAGVGQCVHKANAEHGVIVDEEQVHGGCWRDSDVCAVFCACSSNPPSCPKGQVLPAQPRPCASASNTTRMRREVRSSR